MSGAYSRLVKNSITDNIAQTSASDWNSVGGGVGISLRQAERYSCVLVCGNLIARNKALAPAGNTMASWGGGLSSFGVANASEIINNTVADNVVESKWGSRGGGISVYEGNDQLVKNNVIARNMASTGGGIVCYLEDTVLTISTYPSMMNNAIVSNRATDGTSGGVAILGNWKPIVQSTIIWGNSGGQISGETFVEYCDVQGGYPGGGNINVDPGFADTVSYQLNDTSSCVDAGVPGSLFNDIEDPTNPGYANSPALGTTRNDIGAYGGNPNLNDRPTGVEKREPLMKSYALLQNYPNPFNPTTTIRFEVRSLGFVELKVYDVLGREVEVLVHEVKRAGRYEVKFDASGLSSGVYFCRLTTGTYTSAKKMLLVK